MFLAMYGLAKLKPLWVVALMALASGQSLAGSISGQVGATLVLESSCRIDVGSGAGGSFSGTIDFGRQPANFTGQLTQEMRSGTSSASPTISCSSDIKAITVTVGEGGNAGKGKTVGTGARAMSLAGATVGQESYLPYDIYQDAGLKSAYVANQAVTYALSASKTSVTLNAYGGINKTSTASLAPGEYKDTVNVTIGW